MTTQFVVYLVEFGADLGYGPERWRGMEMGRFDTEAEAEAYADRQWDYVEVVEEEIVQ
jgi:hypothetical protein